MCESAAVRYVHYMQHGSFPETLAVGCICAGRMSEDYAGAERREKDVRALGRRKGAWLRREWRRSAKGNEYVNVQGFNVVIFHSPGGWGFKIERREPKIPHWMPGHEPTVPYFSAVKFPDAATAKLRALSGLIWARAEGL